MKVSQLKVNPDNPRVIKDERFEKLVKSIEDFPEMMEKRPMVCVTDSDGKLFPIGGNMRLKAIQHIGMKEIPDTWVQVADDWTEDQRREFIIKDNVSYGEHNWNELTTEWDQSELEDWGLELPNIRKETPKKQSKEIKPFEMTHILISFPPEKALELQPLFEKILEIEGVEYEQSSN